MLLSVRRLMPSAWCVLAVSASLIWTAADGAELRAPRPPRGLTERIVDGSLRLSIEDAVHLVLLNGTDVQVSYLGYEGAVARAQGARRVFDTELRLGYAATRADRATTSILDGATVLSTTSQNGRASISQTLPTGTRLELSFDTSRNGTNDQFSTFNPSYAAGASLELNQPLLGSQTGSATRARILTADRDRLRSAQDLRTQLTDSVVRAIDAYWAYVQAREGVVVARNSLVLAETSYSRDKRSLELGALPPLEIHRSESAVANRRLVLLQAQQQLRRADQDLRRLVGADLLSATATLPLDLVDTPTPGENLVSLDVAEAQAEAMACRPELEANRLQLHNAETNLGLTRLSLRPDVTLTLSARANEVAGVRLDPSTTPPTVISRNGLGNAASAIADWAYPTYAIGLQVSLPLRRRGVTADVASAEVTQRQTQYQLREREQAVALEVQRAADDLEQAKASMEVARLSRDLSQKTLEAEQKKRDLGEGTLYFVLQAQADLAVAELALLRANIDYQRAATAAVKSRGKLLEKYGVEVR